MTKRIGWLIGFAVVAGLVFLVWRQTRSKPVEVVLEPVTRGTVEKVVANTRAGTVEACRRARLSPSIGGQIAALPVREGDQVEAGALLLEIWNDDLRAQVEVARREVEVARAQAEAECRSAEEAERQAKRAETLYENRVGTQERKEVAVTEAQAQRARCTASRAAVQRSTAQVALARANLDRSRLLAPFAGVVAKIEGEVNEYVTPSPVGVQTPPAIDLIENDCFYVTAPIDEVDAAEVRVGMAVRITLDAYGDKVFAGTVRRIAPYVVDLEKQARTVDIEVDFGAGEEIAGLLAGYSVDVEIVVEARQGVLQLPSEAVVDENTVYVFDEASERVARRDFQPGLSNWDATEAVAGLEEGQRVVVNVDKPGLEDGAAAIAVEPQE